MFEGYETIEILRTTVDTPNQVDTKTGENLAKIAAKKSGLRFEKGKGNFMGFIAYNKEKEDLAIIIRGTILDREWVQNADGKGAAWNDTDITGEAADRKFGPEQFSLAIYETFKPDPSVFLLVNLIASIGVSLFGFFQFASASFQPGNAAGFIAIAKEIVSWLNNGKVQILKQLFLNVLGGLGLNYGLWSLFANPILSLLARSRKKVKAFQSGFSELYTTPTIHPKATSPQRAVYDAIYDTIVKKKLKVKTITTAGHSLGASLAVLAAHHAALTVKDFSAKYGTPVVPVNCITFACPKVGSPEVFKSFKDLGITHYHYLNRGDIVPIVMTGVFTNGLGIDNNHVLRLDPEEVNVFDDEKLRTVHTFLLYPRLFFKP